MALLSFLFDKTPVIETPPPVIEPEPITEPPHIRLYADTSAEVIGKHDPVELATLLWFFQNGDLRDNLTEALIKNGVDNEWADKFQEAATALKKKNEKPKEIVPVISPLRAFQ